MRFWAIVFAILVAWSVTAQQPMYMSQATPSCCEESCESSCEQTAEDKEKANEGDEDCAGNACNPFMVCACCGFLLQSAVHVPLRATFPAKASQLFAHYIDLLPRYEESFFHPPEA
jgi:hypothetical protein